VLPAWSILAAIPARVGASNTAASEISAPKAARTLAMTWVASRE
jgi:hypothetical protein